MKKQIKAIVVIVMAAASLFMAACGNGETSGGEAASQGNVNAEEETIKLGTIWEMSGHGAAYGASQANAVKMAVEEINGEGGVLGRDLELIEYDSKSDDTEAAQLTTRLIAEDNVIAVLGPSYTGGFRAAMPVADQYQVPLFSSSVSDDEVAVSDSGEILPYTWRTATPSSKQTEGLTQFASEELGAEKAIILADNSTDYGKSWSEGFQEHFEGEIVAVENFTTDQTDFSANLTKIQGMDFDVIFIPGYYEQLGPIVKQAREVGVDQPIVGSNGFANPIINELAGSENMTDIYYPTEFFIEGDDTETVTFREKYTEKYPNEPDHLAGLAYDMVYIIAEAIERAGAADSVAVNEELANTDFEGLTGKMAFDEIHDPIKSVEVVEIQDGVPVGVHEVDTQ